MIGNLLLCVCVTTSYGLNGHGPLSSDYGVVRLIRFYLLCLLYVPCLASWCQ